MSLAQDLARLNPPQYDPALLERFKYERAKRIERTAWPRTAWVLAVAGQVHAKYGWKVIGVAIILIFALIGFSDMVFRGPWGTTARVWGVVMVSFGALSTLAGVALELFYNNASTERMVRSAPVWRSILYQYIPDALEEPGIRAFCTMALNITGAMLEQERMTQRETPILPSGYRAREPECGACRLWWVVCGNERVLAGITEPRHGRQAKVPVVLRRHAANDVAA